MTTPKTAIGQHGFTLLELLAGLTLHYLAERCALFELPAG